MPARVSDLGGLRTRLVALVLLAAIPAFGLLVYSAAEQRRASIEQAQREALTVALQIAGSQERLTESARHLLRALAELDALRHPGPGCSELLGRLFRQFPRYANLGRAGVTGDVVCSALPLSEPVNIRDRAYFRRAVESRGFSVGDYQIGRITGRASVNFGHALLDAEARVTGVVFAALDLAWLAEEVRRLPLPPGAVVTVVDGGGRVLVRHPAEAVAAGGNAVDLPAVRAVLAGRRGVLEGPGPEGEPVLFAFAPLPSAGSGPGVIVSVSRRAALGPINRALRRNLVLLGAIAVLVLTVGLVTGEVFVRRPVRAVVAAARRLSSGDLAARVGPPYARGELGELSRAFDEAWTAIARLTRHNALILESVAEGLCGVDRQGRITFVNPAAQALTGYTASELLGESMHRRLHHSLPDGTPYPAEACPTAKTLRDGKVRHVRDEVLWRSDGTPIAVDYLSAPLREGDHVVGAVVVFRDVSALRRAEAELARQREALYQAEKVAAMGALLAGVAHELNNPLSVVLGQASLLRRQAAETAVEDRARRIADAAERCARIVRSFLALARRREPERRHVAVNSLVRDAVELLAYDLRTEDVEVVLDLDEAVPAIEADPHRLHQVLVNLLVNARDALRQRPAGRRVRVATRPTDGGGVRVEVADNGPGIPSDLAERIFEPFFTTKPAGQGTGLGLPLCREVAEEHGGTLTLKAAPEGGACFVLELPAGRPAGSSQTPSTPPQAPSVVGPARLLVVDDEPEILAVLSDILTLDGHRVDTAEDGVVALRRLGQTSYDLVVCDTRMPGLDGPRLYDEVRRRFPGVEHRFIFVTGDELDADKAGFLRECGVPYLAKPFDADQVRVVVREALTGLDRDRAEER